MVYKREIGRVTGPFWEAAPSEYNNWWTEAARTLRLTELLLDYGAVLGMLILVPLGLIDPSFEFPKPSGRFEFKLHPD